VNTGRLYHKLVAIIIFLGDQMTDEQAERIGDHARELSQVELYDLEQDAPKNLYSILRQIAAEKGWM